MFSQGSQPSPKKDTPICLDWWTFGAPLHWWTGQQTDGVALLQTQRNKILMSTFHFSSRPLHLKLDPTNSSCPFGFPCPCFPCVRNPHTYLQNKPSPAPQKPGEVKGSHLLATTKHSNQGQATRPLQMGAAKNAARVPRLRGPVLVLVLLQKDFGHRHPLPRPSRPGPFIVVRLVAWLIKNLRLGARFFRTHP